MTFQGIRIIIHSIWYLYVKLLTTRLYFFEELLYFYAIHTSNYKSPNTVIRNDESSIILGIIFGKGSVLFLIKKFRISRGL